MYFSYCSWEIKKCQYMLHFSWCGLIDCSVKHLTPVFLFMSWTQLGFYLLLSLFLFEKCRLLSQKKVIMAFTMELAMLVLIVHCEPLICS